MFKYSNKNKNILLCVDLLKTCLLYFYLDIYCVLDFNLNYSNALNYKSFSVQSTNFRVHAKIHQILTQGLKNIQDALHLTIHNSREFLHCNMQWLLQQKSSTNTNALMWPRISVDMGTWICHIRRSGKGKL